MNKFETIIIGLMIITVIMGLVLAFINTNNKEKVLSDACDGEELTDWRQTIYGEYEIECNGVIKNESFYICSKPYCAETNKWGDCINWKKHPKELNC